MKRKRVLVRTSILAIVAIAIIYTFYLNFFSDNSVITIGDDATNFILEDLEGNQIELTALKGKGIFLNFWGTYCPECVKEMPIMESLYQEYKQQGIEVIAVNVSEPKLVVEKFVDRLKLSFPIVIDKRGTVTDAYGIRPLPTTILIDENGKVLESYVGPLDEEITRSFMERIKPSS